VDVPILALTILLVWVLGNIIKEQKK